MSFDEKLMDLIEDDLLSISEFGDHQYYLDVKLCEQEKERLAAARTDSPDDQECGDLEEPRQKGRRRRNRSPCLSEAKLSEEEIINRNRKIAMDLQIKNNAEQYRNEHIHQLHEKQQKNAPVKIMPEKERFKTEENENAAKQKNLNITNKADNYKKKDEVDLSKKEELPKKNEVDFPKKNEPPLIKKRIDKKCRNVALQGLKNKDHKAVVEEVPKTTTTAVDILLENIKANLEAPPEETESGQDASSVCSGSTTSNSSQPSDSKTGSKSGKTTSKRRPIPLSLFKDPVVPKAFDYVPCMRKDKGFNLKSEDFPKL